MATENASYFSNAVPGEVVGFDGNIFRLDALATPKYPVGFPVTRVDGNRYRYAQFGAATNRGLLVAPDISEVGVVDTDNGMISPASASDTSYGTINSRKIEITMDGIIANQFAGGYLHTTDDSGEGYTYRIKGNTASGSAGGTDYILELYDPLQVAIDNTTDYTITPCLWNDVEAATAATDNVVSGVSVATSTAAKPYAFVQTRGPATVLNAETVPIIGELLMLSEVTAGAVAPYLTDSVGTVAALEIRAAQIVGYCIAAGDSTGHTSVFLQIE